MSEPMRLRDAADGEVRELMRYAQAQGTPSSARVEALTARVLAELNTPQPEPVRRTFGVAYAKWLIGIAIIVGLGASVPRWMKPERTQVQVPTARAAAKRASEPRPAPSSVLRAQEGGQTPHEAPTQAPLPQARERPREPIKRLASKPAFPGALLEAAADPAEEVALLQRARRALVAEPQAALALATQHWREHPAGMFTEEREAIAVEALWRTGDVGRAAARLRAMLLAYPRSTYRERLTTLLEGAAPEP
jgi:hypothetical protein